jgi:hypothetical protein
VRPARSACWLLQTRLNSISSWRACGLAFCRTRRDVGRVPAAYLSAAAAFVTCAGASCGDDALPRCVLLVLVPVLAHTHFVQASGCWCW